MQTVIAIAAGGAFGAVLRWLVSNSVYQLFGRSLPYGTLAVNVIGSLLIGILGGWFYQRGLLETALAKGLIIGVLGAFTTFSTFSLDTLYLLEQGAVLKALLNILLNDILCLFAVWLGVLIARSI